MQIKFEINWQVQLSRNLRLAWVKLKNLTPFIKDALDIVDNRSKQIFNNAWLNVEKNPIWAPLKTKTIEYKKKKYWSTTPLVNTWRLKNDIVKQASNNQWFLLFKSPYAIYHQEGGKYLPRRAIIDLDNATNRKIIKALQNKINEDCKIFGKQL